MEGTVFLFWNWTIALYLFVAGISAGAFAISALAYFLGEEKYEDITRVGAYIAPFPLILGLLCLIFDLNRPELFWKLLTTLQPYSVMSLGSWLLLIFSPLSLIYFYIWLPERFDAVKLVGAIARKMGGIPMEERVMSSRLMTILGRENLNELRGWIGLIGIPISLLVGIYTGVLLGALVARPFWNNPILPMLFLVSALKTGTASICLIGCFVKGFGGMSREKMETNKFMIHSVDFVLMILAIISILLFVFGLYTSSRSSVEAVHLIMGGPYTFLFWGLVVGVGIIVPLCLEVYELLPHFVRHAALREHNPWISGAVTISVLLGSFVLRYVVVYAGQTPLPITS